MYLSRSVNNLKVEVSICNKKVVDIRVGLLLKKVKLRDFNLK